MQFRTVGLTYPRSGVDACGFAARDWYSEGAVSCAACCRRSMEEDGMGGVSESRSMPPHPTIFVPAAKLVRGWCCQPPPRLLMAVSGCALPPAARCFLQSYNWASPSKSLDWGTVTDFTQREHWGPPCVSLSHRFLPTTCKQSCSSACSVRLAAAPGQHGSRPLRARLPTGQCESARGACRPSRACCLSPAPASFPAVVWKGTTQVGCGYASCSGMALVVW
jgi:hypothetical protein